MVIKYREVSGNVTEILHINETERIGERTRIDLFTGLKDCNGEDLYNNDMIKIKGFFVDVNDEGEGVFEDVVCKINFQNGAFYGGDIALYSYYAIGDTSKIEKI